MTNSGMFDPLLLRGDERDDEHANDARLMRLAQMDPFEQAGYTALSGSHLAGQGLGRTVGAMAGKDVRTAWQKQSGAVAQIKAAVAQSGVKPGSDEYYVLLQDQFQRHGMLDAAERVAQAYEAIKGQRATAQRNEAQAKRFEAQAARDERQAQLQDRYDQILGQIEAQGEYAPQSLFAARDALAKRLGIKTDAPKQDEWQIVAPTQYSPGYRINRRTGETVELDGRIAKPGEGAGADASPFGDLAPETRRAAERASGKDVAEWVGGGRASALRGIEALRDVVEQLRENPDLVNDPLSSNLPDAMRAMTEGGRAALNARDTVRTAIQATLRQVMGAAYTEKEGRDMFNRAWDPKLGVEENIERVNRALLELEEKFEAKDALSRGNRPEQRAPRDPRGDAPVRIRLPDGRIGSIPRSRLAAAKARGAVELR